MPSPSRFLLRWVALMGAVLGTNVAGFCVPSAPQCGRISGMAPVCMSSNSRWGGREKNPSLRGTKLRPSKELDLQQEEKRMRQTIATYPMDVDALCEYACFLACVKRDFKGASENYSQAIKADATRARRIAVQLWSDSFAVQVEREAAFRIKEQWMTLFASMDHYKDGFAPRAELLETVLRLGAPDDPKLHTLLDMCSSPKDGLVDCFRLSDGLRIEPDKTRYRFIRFTEKILGRTPVVSNPAADTDPVESPLRATIRRFLLGRALPRPSARLGTVTRVKEKSLSTVNLRNLG